MSESIKKLIDKAYLREISQSLTVAQLEAALDNLRLLIEEKHHADQDRELSRKGARVLDDMRGLMAKAGISMTDLQKALDDL